MPGLFDARPATVEKLAIRASAGSARWCAETIKLLWKNRHDRISTSERDEAQRTYEKAIETYQRIGEQAEQGT